MNKQGFTIVELLIVIVVIAILATISVVTYNGVQQRANNVKTENAFAAWIKALKLYKADKGQYPAYYTCLGEGYKYGPSGADASGIAQCRQTSTTNLGTENAAFVAAIKPYLGNTIPTPAFVTTYSNDTYWWRGITYVYGGGTGTSIYFDVSYAGDVNPCPTVGGVVPTSRSVISGNTYCNYAFGLTTDP